MEMICSLVVFVEVAAIKFSVQNEYLTLRVCARTSRRDLHREGKINHRQIGCCELLVC